MSQYRGMLCPFAPLAVSFSGKGDIKNIDEVRVARDAYASGHCFDVGFLT